MVPAFPPTVASMPFDKSRHGHVMARSPFNARAFLRHALLLSAYMASCFAAVTCAEPVDAAGPAFASAESNPDGVAQFEREVRPVLVQHCYECHSAKHEAREADLELDSQAGLRRGGERGPIVVPGSSQASLLIAALRHDGLEMPPERRLDDETIQAVATWIDRGAPMPDDAHPQLRERSDAAGLQDTFDWAKARATWAFQPPRVAAVPSVDHPRWPNRHHDFFVLAQLERQSRLPAPPVAAAKLVRRLAFDLTGLPPSSLSLDEYWSLKDELTEQQVVNLVDTLLASPHFGERWARMWLDLARYAEDQAHIVGNNKSLFYPNAYLYRDWVIGAFNRDMPYDRFITLQLAADLVEDGQDDLAALGFLGLGPKYYDRGRLAVKAEEWEDRVDTVSRTFLGLTVACARCHDHKYDPISTVDYYALASVFASTRMFNQPLDESVETKGDQAKEPGDSLHVVREGKPTDLAVFVRGNVEVTGVASHRGFLTVLSPSDEPLRFENGSGRLELAHQIARPDNPLTARVFVNRVWDELIGQPLVGTPSNFGQLGSEPTHPQLLDDLAVRFIANGWSTKWLVKEIVTSATYRQSSTISADDAQQDPENRWIGHMNRKRLRVEAWRDSLLAAAGQLESRVGGPSMVPSDTKERRRTLYSGISRFELNPLLAVFDFPDPNVHSAQRSETITPQQRLVTMNHPFVLFAAKATAERLSGWGSDHDDVKIDAAYRTLFWRTPKATERQVAHEFLSAEFANGVSAWPQWIHALMASNEMMFID